MLFLTEQDVLQAIEGRNAYAEAVAVIEEVLRQQSEGSTFHLKRLTMEHPDHPGHLWHNIRILPGMAPELGYAAVRVYSGYQGTNRSEVICLFNWEDMEMSAIISDYHLHAIRTASPYGVAAKYLARADAQTLGVIGTGRYAKGFVQACCAVRDIRRIKAYSRSTDNRRRFREEMTAVLGIEVVTVDSGREAVEGTDIMLLATSGNTIVFEGAWLEPGRWSCLSLPASSTRPRWKGRVCSCRAPTRCWATAAAETVPFAAGQRQVLQGRRGGRVLRRGLREEARTRERRRGDPLRVTGHGHPRRGGRELDLPAGA